MMQQRPESVWFTLAREYSDSASNESFFGKGLEESKAIVLEYVWNQMRLHGEEQPPFITNDSSDFIGSRRAKVREIEIPDSDGYLVPTVDGFDVYVRTGLEPHRRRSVLAHEIGHTFLFDTTESPPRMRTHSSGNREWRNVEGPSYEIGRQILMPSHWLKKLAKEPSLENFIELKRIFRTTNHMLARRIVQDLKVWDVCVMVGAVNSPQFAQGGKFRGQSFKSFNVEKNANHIRPVFREASSNLESIIRSKLRLENRLREVEAIQTVNGVLVCMIRNPF